jgi:thioredoxin 1
MIEITDRDFDKEVLKCDLPVFACFTTPWCHTCFPTCLLADKLLNKYGDMVKYVRIKAEESPEVIQRYNIIVVPTILLFQNSQPVKKLIGFHDLKSLRALLDSVINESDRLPGGRLEENKARENE